jgi:uncharacterized membrane protein
MKTQDRVYESVHRVLYGGMIASTLLFAVGIAAALWRRERVPLDAAWIRAHYHTSAILHGLATFEPMTIMMLATALLILTPVARVAVSIYVFARDGDRKFVLVTSLVAAIMVATLFLARAGLT